MYDTSISLFSDRSWTEMNQPSLQGQDIQSGEEDREQFEEDEDLEMY